MNESENNAVGCLKIAAVLCKRCRIVLATFEDILLHTPPTTSSKHVNFTKSRKNQNYRDRNKQNLTSKPLCASIFIKKPEWLDKITEESQQANNNADLEDSIEPGEAPVDGKLCCPKCDFKLGSYSWYGMPCTCGTWINPSFSIQKARVDIERDTDAAP